MTEYRIRSVPTVVGIPAQGIVVAHLQRLLVVVVGCDDDMQMEVIVAATGIFALADKD